MNENAERAKAILAQIEYVTLATSSLDGSPWNAPVWAAFDEAYHCFWVSAKEARHSQDIRANPRVALVVYDSTVAPKTGKAVYIQARAEELSNEQDAAHALAQLRTRGWEAPPAAQEVLGASLRGVYRAIPEKVWINTKNVHGLDARMSIDLRHFSS